VTGPEAVRLLVPPSVQSHSLEIRPDQSFLKILAWANGIRNLASFLLNYYPTPRFVLVPCPHKPTSRWLLWYYTLIPFHPCDSLDRISFLKRASDVFFGLRHVLTLLSDEIPRENPFPDGQTPVSHSGSLTSSPALTSALPDRNTRKKMRRFSFRKSQRRSQDANRLEEGKERRLVPSILLALYMRRGHGRVA
jgi:hypothetical protein